MRHRSLGSRNHRSTDSVSSDRLEIVDYPLHHLLYRPHTFESKNWARQPSKPRLVAWPTTSLLGALIIGAYPVQEGMVLVEQPAARRESFSAIPWMLAFQQTLHHNRDTTRAGLESPL
jgi:hypothetical protein